MVNLENFQCKSFLSTVRVTATTTTYLSRHTACKAKIREWKVNYNLAILNVFQSVSTNRTISYNANIS